MSKNVGLLIWQSFDNWDKNPVSTTISSHPIDKVTFPKIFICPPEGTVTNLNYDITNTKNISLTSSQIKLLLDLVDEKIEEAELHKFKIGLESFVEQDKYRNWFNGSTAITSKIGLAEKTVEQGFQYHKIKVNTSATAGTIRSPHFGETFDKDNFYYRVWYQYFFTNLVTKTSSDQILVIEVKGDTKETAGGNEAITINEWRNGKRADQLFEHKNSGPVLKTLKFNLTEVKDLHIFFWRKCQSIHVEEWNNKRMTGMEIKWHSAP